MKKLTTILLLILLQNAVFSQEQAKGGSFFTVGLAYLELKDGLNHGLVFKGPDLSFEYGIERLNNRRYYSYSISVAGGGKTQINSWGFTWLLSPVNAHYSWKVFEKGDSWIFLGPSMLVNYRVQNYTELHAGPISWLTSYDLGFQASGFFNLKNKSIKVHLRNTVAGWNSRPPEERNPYYFTTKIGDNFSDMHSNMVFGTINKYSQTELSVALLLGAEKRQKALAYTVQYTGYFPSPAYRQVIHGIKYTWYLHKSKT